MAKKSIKGKKIVCLGGGNAMPKAVLSSLKNEPVKISVICAMLDSGGSAGRLRRDYKIVSPGDIRRAFIALANTSPAVGDLFDYRFESGELAGHNFANLLITALELSSQNYKVALNEITKLLNISPNHKVLPATLDKAEVCAQLEDGTVIKGETNIDVPKHDAKLAIKKVFLRPAAKAYKAALDEIKTADLIVIGPGDLYSSLAQVLLVDGMDKAICKSEAKKLYICNLLTKKGETHGFSVGDFAQEIEEFLSCPLDYVIYNNKKLPDSRIKISRKEDEKLLEMVPVSNDLDKQKFIGADIATSKGIIEHDSKKLVKVILSLLCKSK